MLMGIIPMGDLDLDEISASKWILEQVEWI
jgi:hypothetical protein